MDDKNKQLLNRLLVSISGMHCRACEIRVEESLSRLPGVIRVKADSNCGQAEIEYSLEVPSDSRLSLLIEELGYKFEKSEIKGPVHPSKENTACQSCCSGGKPSRNKYLSIALWVAAAAVMFLFLRNLSFDPSSWIGEELTWSLVVLVGLAAGFSTCMALVGGLVLSVSANYYSQHPEAKFFEKFKPHLFFHAGRIVGFGILGALLGLLGSFWSFSPTINIWLTFIIAIIMLVTGLKLLGVGKGLAACSIALPKGFAKIRNWKIINSDNKKWLLGRLLLAGALTFFLPCGFTQAMQLVAVNTGNPMSGALVMSLFALGTAPGLLMIGGAAAAAGGKWLNKISRLAGILVIVLAILSLKNVYSLFHSFSVSTKPSQAVAGVNIEMDNGQQIIRMEENSRGYSPNEFTIVKGVPVRWIVDAKSPYSCASSLVAPAIGVNKRLEAGENIIEFTPQQSGQVAFSCSMGMYTGRFNVVEKNN